MSGSSQRSFDFDLPTDRERRESHSRIWLFAADAENKAPRKPKCIFLNPFSGASAIPSKDLVLVRAYQSFYDIYASADTALPHATKNSFNSLLKQLQRKGEKTQKTRQISNAIMIGFVAGTPRAPGVLHRDRTVECKTEFERLLRCLRGPLRTLFAI